MIMVGQKLERFKFTPPWVITRGRRSVGVGKHPNPAKKAAQYSKVHNDWNYIDFSILNRQGLVYKECDVMRSKPKSIFTNYVNDVGPGMVLLYIPVYKHSYYDGLNKPNLNYFRKSYYLVTCVKHG